MSLKVELKPGEKLLIGNCVVTNSEQRTRIFIDGRAPILREKDILTVETADSPARRIYLAVQLMYINEDLVTLRSDYFQLINDIVKAAPSTIPIVDEINNEILTGFLYKALKAAKKLEFSTNGTFSHMHRQGAAAYQMVAKQTASPRDLEANLLSKAAANFQRIRDNWDVHHRDLHGALRFNRRLWNVFLTSVTREDNPLPRPIRENVANLGLFVLSHTLRTEADPQAHKLDVLININRELASGLRAAADNQ